MTEKLLTGRLLVKYQTYKKNTYTFHWAINNGSEQPVWLCNLVCVFAVHMHQYQDFLWHNPNYILPYSLLVFLLAFPWEYMDPEKK